MLKASTPTCKKHGRMVLRPASSMTPEQRFCGTWYDCPLCHDSVLEPSPELIKHLDEMKQRRERPRQSTLAV